jgi:hypothetical protein
MLGRFHTFTEGSQVIVIPRDLEYERPKLPENNYIDRHVHNKLHKLRIIPSDLCERRGLPAPRLHRHRRRAAHARTPRRLPRRPGPDKREKLVDELISRKEFTEMWVMKWAELLQIRTFNQGGNRVSYKAALGYYDWLRERIARQHSLQPDRARPALRPRRHLRQPRHQLLPDRTGRPETNRKRRPGLHGHTHPVRAVPQPSLRPLDDG